MQIKAKALLQISSFILTVNLLHTNALSLDIVKKLVTPGHDHSTHAHKDDHVHSSVCELPHYGENPKSTRKLVLLEEKLVNKLSKFVTNNEKPESVTDDSDKEKIEDLCQKHISKYLKDYNDDTLAIEKDRQRGTISSDDRADIVIVNPILSIKLLRRIVKNVMNEILTVCINTTKAVENTLTQLFEKEHMVPPTPAELKRSYAGLMAITFIYGINTTNDERHGKFAETSAQLKYEDFMALARYALEFDKEGWVSFHWLKAASNALISEGELIKAEDTQELNQEWVRLMNITGLSTTEDLEKLRQQWESTWHQVHYEHEDLCRGEGVNIPRLQHPKDLKCAYIYDWLYVYRYELLSSGPLIIQFHQFLTEKEINFIRNESPTRIVNPSMIASRASFKSDKDYKDALVAKLLEVANEKNKNPIVRKLVHKVFYTTRLHVAVDRDSIYELALYSPLSQWFNVEKNRGTLLPYDPYGNDSNERSFATFLMFLSNVRMGGYNTFPDLNIFVRPEKGSAIFFYNFNIRGQLIPSLYHESCPVVLGIKEVANIPLMYPQDGKVQPIML